LGGYITINTEVYDATGKSVDVSCYTTFGDGGTTTECNPKHIYKYAGEYVSKTEVRSGTLRDDGVIGVAIIEPKLYLSMPESREYIELHNASEDNAELNGWYIRVGYKRFNIPAGTIVPAGSSIKISQGTMRINIVRVGGKAELYNIFNKMVDYKPSVLESSMLELSTVGIVESLVSSSSEEAVDTAQDIVGLSTVVDDNVVDNNLVDSIIGVSVEPIISVADDKLVTLDNARYEDEAINNVESQVSSVAVSKSTDYVWWILAVIALCCLAILPLFGRVADATTQSQQYIEGDDGFDIREVE
jgi:PKD repeat protein